MKLPLGSGAIESLMRQVVNCRLKGTGKFWQALRQLLLDRAKENDALVYFTGHGIRVVDSVVGKSKGYLATSDCAIAVRRSGCGTATRDCTR